MHDVYTAEHAEKYVHDGYLLLPGFYDLDKEIRPIQESIFAIINLVREMAGLRRLQVCDPDYFDEGFGDLIALDRKWGGVVYDAVKQVPAFVRLVSSEKHEKIYRYLIKTDVCGLAGGGHGIRIDNPNEDVYRTEWHQEYPAQLRSVDGAVFWSPLVKLTEELGPVKVCPKSHREGLIPVLTIDPDAPTKTGAYALIFKNKNNIIAKYEQISPLLQPGDLLIMDFKTVHASGFNRSSRSRWSMQSRLFNFNDPVGRNHRWSGSFATGKRFQDIHPELVG